MASMLREIARRSAQHIVKSPTKEAWETTGNLRRQYVMTTMDAMPARVEEASKEWRMLREKFSKRDFSLNDIAVGAMRTAELYAFYFIGKSIGARSIPA